MAEQLTPMVMAKIKTILSQPNGLSIRLVDNTHGVAKCQEAGQEVLRNGKSEFKKMFQTDSKGSTLCRFIEIDEKKYICDVKQWQTIEDLLAPVKLRNLEMSKVSKSMDK